MISTDLLKTEASSHGIFLDELALKRFDIYAELLVDWNKKVNLTAITDPTDIVYKHFLDSIIILKYYNIPIGSSLVDVGTGAGFPGIPLLIARPDLKITLIDSTTKKLNVISDILVNLDLNADIEYGRAEDLARKPKFREKFDFATARAVTNFRDLSEFCLPFVKVGGSFIPLKGANGENELYEAEVAIDILGGLIQDIQPFELPNCGERFVFRIEKISHTPTKYPRPYAQISKKPIC